MDLLVPCLPRKSLPSMQTSGQLSASCRAEFLPWRGRGYLQQKAASFSTTKRRFAKRACAEWNINMRVALQLRPFGTCTPMLTRRAINILRQFPLLHVWWWMTSGKNFLGCVRWGVYVNHSIKMVTAQISNLKNFNGPWLAREIVPKFFSDQNLILNLKTLHVHFPTI